MKPETRNCQNCKKDFTIETEDFNFYEKIKVPAPTWCPECRLIRRINCGNGWTLFYRNCDKCGKRTLSMYHPDQKINTYCQPCWWADDWDGSEYATGYDPGRPFFEQLKDLTEKTPYSILESTYSTLKDCEYSNSIAYSRNCTLVVWADFCEYVCLSSVLNGLKYSSDCLRGFSSELCYGSIGFSRCYRMFFSDECDDCVDVWFSRNCYGCTNCVGCANLSGAQNCIFNVKYEKAEYEKKLQDLKLDTWEGQKDFEKKAHEFWLTLPYRAYHGHSLNKNVTGDYVFESKNSKEVYIFNGGENSKWCQLITVKPVKDCYDYSGWGNDVELLYECTHVGDGSSNSKFSAYCFPDVLNTEYCLWCPASKNNFGCVNLKRKQYCILNKQYSREEYEKLKIQIIEDMKKNPYVDEKGRVWSYGEFFQPGFSKFPYNNSNAGKFIPKTKEEALKLGYSWADEVKQNIVATISASELPKTILEANDSVLNEVISCVLCDKKYKIIPLEFDLLRKINLPIPHECSKCRENKRFARMTKPGLFDRECRKCGIKVKTPYAPDRPEIIYCESCYQKEVY